MPGQRDGLPCVDSRLLEHVADDQLGMDVDLGLPVWRMDVVQSRRHEGRDWRLRLGDRTDGRDRGH
ncbi:hypothetical protein F6B41_33245 [Microbacterium lushaniae]|nr:hypothetical protein F6B41_33245 [Microbacterium lushaniae]